MERLGKLPEARLIVFKRIPSPRKEIEDVIGKFDARADVYCGYIYKVYVEKEKVAALKLCLEALDSVRECRIREKALE